MFMAKLPICRWPEGYKCFAYTSGRCKILKDCNFLSKDCPFRKSYSQVLKEDPDYYGRGENNE